MILFILGPSGAGKSSMGRFLAQQGWLHLEIDRYPEGDGIDLEKLRDEWDEFWVRHKSDELIREIRRRSSGNKGCVVTFPGRVVFSPQHLKVCKGQVGVAVLYGTAADCIRSFLSRERETSRALDIGHWVGNNRDSYNSMSSPELEPYRVAVFSAVGSRRPYEDVMSDILKICS